MGKMMDLIERAAAIDAKQEFRNPNVVRNTEARTAYDRTYANGWNDCNSAWINAIKALPSAQPETSTEIQEILNYLDTTLHPIVSPDNWYVYSELHDMVSMLPSAQPESTRTFVELVVRYPDPELCAYKEYKGKPYYSIKYIENGETYVGYGTYNPEVLSQYLKEYFISSAQPGPEIHWGYTPTYERPLADREIVPRLRDIQKQVGGSYAIDRAIEIIEAVAERRTDELGNS